MADGVQQTKGNEGNEDQKRQRLDKVRRRLDFEDENHPTTSEMNEDILSNDEKTRQFFKKQTEEATVKWNFDFVNDMPLEGDWEWEKVEVGHQLDYKELTTENKVKSNEENRNV